MTNHRSLLIAAALGLTSAAVAGCGSTTGNGSGAVTPSAGSTATVSVSAPASPTAQPSGSAQPTQPTPSAVALPACHDADLAVAGKDGGAATGHIALLITFTNQSARPCYLKGFPEASLVDASGKVLLQAQDRLNGFIGAAVYGGPALTAPPYVVLEPSRTVMAVLEWEDVDPIQGVPGGCLVRQSAGVVVTAPGSSVTTKLPGVSFVCDALQINPVINKAPQ